MPSKTSKKKAAVELPRIPKEVIDQLVSGPMTAPHAKVSPRNTAIPTH